MDGMAQGHAMSTGYSCFKKRRVALFVRRSKFDASAAVKHHARLG